MLYAETSGDPAVRAFASTPKANRLVLSVFNDSPQEKKITVNPGMNVDGADIRLRSAYYADSVLKHAEETMTFQGEGLPLSLAPYGVYSIRWDLKKEVTVASKTLKETGFYSPTVNTVFENELELSIPAEREPENTETVLLRLALHRVDAEFAKNITLKLNEQTIQLLMGDSINDLMDGNQNVWYFSIPVARKLVGVNNQLSLSDAGSGYRVMFAALTFEEHPDSLSAGRVEKEGIATWEKAISSSVGATKQMLANSPRKFDLTIQNRLARPMEYMVKIKKPDALVLQEIATEQKVTVDAGSSKTISGTMSLKPVDQLIESRIDVDIVASNGLRKTHNLPINLFPLRQAVKVDFQVKTDGDLSEWSQKQPTVFERHGISTKTWLGWDNANLYVAVQVDGKFKARRPESLEKFWTRDCIELFIDAKNQKTAGYNTDSAQLFLCPLGISDDLPFGGKVLFKKMGDFVRYSGSIAEPKIAVGSRVGDSGYSIEATIPWSVISTTFVPAAGNLIGMDVAIDHINGTDGVNLSTSILGLKAKEHTSPAKWGSVVLE